MQRSYIPNFGQYKPKREGFIYNANLDQYEFLKGHKAVLKFKRIKTNSNGYNVRSYRSSESDCKDCPLRAQCCGKVTKFKKIEDSVDKPYYDRMHAKLTSKPNKARAMSRIRSKSVEPVLGTLVNFTAMKKVNTKGIEHANKHIIMASLAYNIKKLMSFQSIKKQISLMHK